MTALYDSIGRTYSGRRESDPRIAAAIEAAVDGCDSILNVGAGTGSYEPASKSLIAVEPSRTMISQRRPGAAPVVQGLAESLPFRDGSFDAVLGILTVHHWIHKERGFSECRRVARSRVVFFTIDFDVCARFWSRWLPGRVLEAATSVSRPAGSSEHLDLLANRRHERQSCAAGNGHRVGCLGTTVFRPSAPKRARPGLPPGDRSQSLRAAQNQVRAHHLSDGHARIPNYGSPSATGKSGKTPTYPRPNSAEAHARYWWQTSTR
jgi:SAM-dependent methyltransferase